jgi:hypothetical protein
MKDKIHPLQKIYLLVICMVLAKFSSAQYKDCVFKDTLFNIDFGTSINPQLVNLNMLKAYSNSSEECPEDGFYGFKSHTANCFNDDWFALPTDHTPGDVAGNMMIVNSAYKAGMFFIATLNGFKPNRTYEFGVWMMNICRLRGGCPPIPPDISITLETPDGILLVNFGTGILAQSDIPKWKRFFGYFNTPANTTTLILKMVNHRAGGCGNDFALDDITIKPCEIPVPKIKKEEAPIKQQPIIHKPIPAPQTKTVSPLKKNNTVFETKQGSTKKINLQKINTLNIPERIQTRENLVIKEIGIAAGEVTIELYDNGIIDGDTVSIYHNNELVVSRAGLSEKAIRFHITLAAQNPHHEITMVADNLGSIPPNTSLMIVTANNLRKEIFISSTEQKNAKIVFKLKE